MRETLDQVGSSWNYDKLDQVNPFSFFLFKKWKKQKSLSLILDLKVVGEYFL